MTDPSKNGGKPSSAGTYPPAEDMLAEAHFHHQAGHLLEAEALYRRILADHSGHVGALYHLGVAVAQRGDRRTAETLIRQALVFDPSSAEAHNNLGVLLK